MFSCRELKQASVYQNAHDEDRIDRSQSLVMGLLLSQVKAIAPTTEAQIRSLSLSKLEKLGESLFSFTNSADLNIWLKENW